jgi:hypothetical protein
MGSPAGRRARARVGAVGGVIGALLVCAALVFSGSRSPTALLAFRAPRRASLYWHGPGEDAVTFNGVGPGGSVGPVYHWATKSFSPTGNVVPVAFSHDHAAREPGSGLEPYIAAPENEAVRAELEVPVEDPLEGLQPMTYFAKMFPIEKGYSSNLFDYHKNDPKPKAVPESLWYCRRVCHRWVEATCQYMDRYHYDCNVGGCKAEAHGNSTFRHNCTDKCEECQEILTGGWHGDTAHVACDCADYHNITLKDVDLMPDIFNFNFHSRIVKNRNPSDYELQMWTDDDLELSPHSLAAAEAAQEYHNASNELSERLKLIGEEEGDDKVGAAASEAGAAADAAVQAATQGLLERDEGMVRFKVLRAQQAAEEAQRLANLTARMAAASEVRAEALRAKAALAAIQPELAVVAEAEAEHETQMAKETAEEAARAVEHAEKITQFANSAHFHQVAAGNAMIFGSGRAAPHFAKGALPDGAAAALKTLATTERAALKLESASGLAAAEGDTATDAEGGKWWDNHGRAITPQHAKWYTKDTTSDFALQKEWTGGPVWWKAPA